MSANNPFAPSAYFAHSPEQQAASRYPDISNTIPQQQQQHHHQQYQQYGYGQQQQQQPQSQPQMYPQQTGYGQQQQQQGGFQPSSQFGQFLQSQGTGLNFGAPYNPSPQPGHGIHHQLVADLDPFSRQGQQQQQQQPSYNPQYQQQQQQQQQQQPQYQTTPQQQADRELAKYGEHPRDYFRSNKTGLEQWNQQAWSRARALLNQLEQSWEERKRTVADWATWNLGVQDRDTVDQLRKEADSNIDTVAAYTLQVKEVFESYRHSSDQSSRVLVRQALNQGLQTLPDWPKTLEAPPKLPSSSSTSSNSTSLFDSLSPQQQQNYYNQNQNQNQNQPQMYGQHHQQQEPQQQPMMYSQQTGYPNYQQQQLQHGMMYGQPQQQQQQQPGMYGRW